MALKLTHSFPIFAPPLDPNPPRPSSELQLSRSDRPSNARRILRPAGPVKRSRSPTRPNVDQTSHPAFRFSNITKTKPRPVTGAPDNVKISEDGLSYVIDGAPFEFKYSYTETPKAKPIKMREPPFVPFGPAATPRPWTGRAPLPPSKKKLKEFDSFVLPPPYKKGVKPVQSPGPYLPGTGPQYVNSREEVLGEPLTREEIRDLVRSCIRTQRQLNMGRDGLTHNMLDNIHAHWKRRRVCKIRCKGVCTVDMDNVCHQLEEKTGGKIIYRNGGVLYLFRGRNYNYKTHPRFPLMLWKPVPPVYPRLTQRVPEGLTLEEATKMREKGSTLIPICKLGKNGVYCNLAKTVREAFEECELVRINCQGLNKSDYRKIGAKLRDLVPCTLLSFQDEHILMWRGPNWKSSLPNLGDDSKEASQIEVDNKNYKPLPSEDLEFSASGLQKNPVEHASDLSHDTSSSSSSSDVILDKVKVPCPVEHASDVSHDTSSSSSSSDVILDKVKVPCAVEHASDLSHDTSSSSSSSDVILDEVKMPCPNENSKQSMFGVTEAASLTNTYLLETTNNATDSNAEPEPCMAPSLSMNLSHNNSHADCPSKGMDDSHGTEDITYSKSCSDDLSTSISGSDAMQGGSDDSINGGVDPHFVKLLDDSEEEDVNHPLRPAVCMNILFLLEQAIQKGSALVLDKDSLDADHIYQNTVAFAQSAPPGPVFRQHNKVVTQKSDKRQGSTSKTKETSTVYVKRKKEKSTKIPSKANFDDQLLNVVPQGTLGIDELAKLLT